MIVDFAGIPEQKIPHFQGGEKEFAVRMLNAPACRILHGRLIPGASIGLHTHETSSEIIYVLSGSGKVLYDGAWEEISAGQAHYCPKGHAHSLVNSGSEELVFFAAVPEQ